MIDINWRSTRILTRDNRQVAIPNSVISKGLIANYFLPDRMFRIETFVIVYCGQDVEHVRNLIFESLAYEDWIIHDKSIQALLYGFTEFGVQFKVRCWIENYVGTRISENRRNKAIYKALTGAGISMAIGTSLLPFILLTRKMNR